MGVGRGMIHFPPPRETLSELYQAVKCLQSPTATTQRVPLIKPARFMQRRAACHAVRFGIKIEQRAHEGHLYIRRVLEVGQ